MNHIDLSNFYTPLSTAKKEIMERWNNIDLRMKIEKFLGQHMIKSLGDKPYAILNRNIISPNTELRYFLDHAESIDLPKILLEYNGKFVSKNLNHYHLGKLYFYNGLGKNNGLKIKLLKIIDFNISDGKHFNDINTLWGESLKLFHHHLLFINHPELEECIVDFTDSFNSSRFITTYYYLYYLSHFICHGILFENFLIKNKGEDDFFREKVLPSFKRIEEIFGIKPLIVPLLPFENEQSCRWMYYSEDIYKDVEKSVLGVQ